MTQRNQEVLAYVQGSAGDHAIRVDIKVVGPDDRLSRDLVRFLDAMNRIFVSAAWMSVENNGTVAPLLLPMAAPPPEVYMSRLARDDT